MDNCNNNIITLILRDTGYKDTVFDKSIVLSGGHITTLILRDTGHKDTVSCQVNLSVWRSSLASQHKHRG